MHPLHRRRLWWFTVLSVGLIIIQFAYNIHSVGRPQILGYATSLNTEELLKETNDYRARNNLPPLKLSDNLDRGAQAKAENMVANNYWSHVAPDGTTPWYFFQKVGYQYMNAGENLAYGFSTSDQVVTAWMNSLEHRQNILGKYQDVGFGYANGAHYQNGNNTVIVAFYGQPDSTQPLVTVTGNSPAQPPAATVHAAQDSKQVSGVGVIAQGNAPWAAYASLALIGASLLGFIVTHLELLRLGWHKTRRYAAMHPAVDAAVLLVLVILVVQAAGGFIQ